MKRSTLKLLCCPGCQADLSLLEKVRLADIGRQGGSRPLNLRRLSGQVVRLVLADPSGAWATAAPAIAVTLAWQ